MLFRSEGVVPDPEASSVVIGSTPKVVVSPGIVVGTAGSGKVVGSKVVMTGSVGEPVLSSVGVPVASIPEFIQCQIFSH